MDDAIADGEAGDFLRQPERADDALADLNLQVGIRELGNEAGQVRAAGLCRGIKSLPWHQRAMRHAQGPQVASRYCQVAFDHETMQHQLAGTGTVAAGSAPDVDIAV
jgi:hypothetical protein